MNFEEWAKTSKWNFDSSEYAREIKTIAEAAWEAAQPKWQPIETAPTGINILIYYKNNLNKGRIVKAQFIKKHTLEASDVNVCDDFAEYSEEHDNYFIPEGWYESIDNWEEFGSLLIYQGKPTHWMPLPNPPQEVAK